MALRKHGVGEILPEPEEPKQHTAASQPWDGQDEQALQEEGEE